MDRKNYVHINYVADEILESLIDMLQDKHEEAVITFKSTKGSRDVMLTHFGKASAYLDAMEMVVKMLHDFNDMCFKKEEENDIYGRV